MTSTSLVWFRKDLRLLDNVAFAKALGQHVHVILIYILEEESVRGVQKWWLYHSLKALSQALNSKGLQLTLRKGQAIHILQDLVQRHCVSALYYNRCYEPWEQVRDQQIHQHLTAQGVDVYDSPGNLLIEPWETDRPQGFKVYTPFWNHISKKLSYPPATAPLPVQAQGLVVDSQDVDSWLLTENAPDFSSYWTPGELGACQKLETFLEEGLPNYKKGRDFPASSAISGLSPYLHFGEIHIWRVFEAVKQQGSPSDCELCFLKELGWREFAYHTLHHFPEVFQRNLRKEFDHFLWDDHPERLKKWQQGLTGYPVVDAGMRELLCTGFMHNRVRMIVASFLTKDLLIDWRLGAEWFLEHLLDGDLASNSMNWQWCAGTGIDASPYFRIFNPVLQSQKFDPSGEYIRRWVPELRGLSDDKIHIPWDSHPYHDYPAPVVQHNNQRAQALRRYADIRQAVDS